LPRDPKYAALSAITKTLIENRGKASEADIERFVSAGYSRAQIFEVVLGTGISMTTATATNMADTPIEDHFKAQTWAAA
jgi:alkylhydroperoxidase family enzyme